MNNWEPDANISETRTSPGEALRKWDEPSSIIAWTKPTFNRVMGLRKWKMLSFKGF
jgi:hypothetical protein